MNERERAPTPSDPSVHEKAEPRVPDRWARESFTFRRMSDRDIALFSIGLLVLALLVTMWLAA